MSQYFRYPVTSGGGSSGSQTGVAYVVGPLDGAPANAQGGFIGSFTFYQQSATAVFPGLVSSANQSFSGQKTFSTTRTTTSIIGSISFTQSAGGTAYNLVLPVLQGSASHVLQNDGSGNLSWIQNGDTAPLTVGTPFASSTTQLGAVIGSNTLFLQMATSGASGLVSSGTQIFAGAKTFNGGVTSPAFITQTSNPASTGVLRLANTDAIRFRDNDNNANLSLTVGSGNFFYFSSGVNADGTLVLGSITFTQAAGGSNYPIVYPLNQGSASAALTNDGSGNLSWTIPAGGQAPTQVGPPVITTTQNAAVIGSNTLYLQFASSTFSGIISSAAQSITGAKTFLTSVSAPAFITTSSGPANAGTVRLSNTDSIRFRNSANNGNFILICGSSDALFFDAGFGSHKFIIGSTTVSRAADGTIYPLVLPANQGAANTFFTNDGSGNINFSFPGANLQTITANYTMLPTDTTIVCASATYTLTLSSNSITAGRLTYIKRFGAAVVGSNALTMTVSASAGTNIDGVSTIHLVNNGDYLVLEGDGTNARIVSEKITCYASWHTTNGYGSTDTTIRKFTTVVTNVGNAFTISSNSAVTGDAVYINLPGVYSFTLGDSADGNDSFGLSLNSAQTTTGIASINQGDVLTLANTTAANFTLATSWTGPLKAGDVVRPHCSGSGAGANPERSHFTAARL